MLSWGYEMNKILYPLIATAFITISPYLLTFEKGQDLVRGIFDFSILTLLLLFVHLRDSKIRGRIAWLAIVVVVVCIISFVDLQNILFHKKNFSSWIFVLPIVTTSLSFVIVKNAKKLALNTVSFILFLLLGIHVVCFDFFPSQPILETPLINALPRYIEFPLNRKILSQSLKSRYEVLDTSTITLNFIDSTRNNVVVLVESWGVPLDISIFKEELEQFSQISKKTGIHSRMYSKTRTAEREDLLFTIKMKNGGFRDSVFIPSMLKDLNFFSTYIFGGDSLVQHRDRYIKKLGFDENLFFKSRVSDMEIASVVDSLLTVGGSQKSFIAWTTRDTQFPMGDDAASVEKIYFKKMHNTLKIVADLAKKHPETRFIVQGDHEPILSPRGFREKFYRRWVPYVILN